ncbi:MAG TPA: TetR/AcrR family transcriptional regulator [Microlunatus sp.]|nr:TetR/AcrR family transcriptional regulator [Microlunatus sp.]
MPRSGGKRQDVLAGGLTIFARDGYTRASIDAIAAQAGVSTRTIYNHFQDKADLFRAVIQESAARVTEAQIAIIDRHLAEITDLEQDLVAFGLAWLAPMPDFAEHSALVRQINAEAGHIPQPAIRAWQQAGPLRVLDALADRLAGIADLEIDDPRRAAHHFSVLIMPPNLSFPGALPRRGSRADAVRAGVRVFLHGYLGR